MSRRAGSLRASGRRFREGVRMGAWVSPVKLAIVVDWVAAFVDSTLKVEDVERRMAQRIKVTLDSQRSKVLRAGKPVPPSFTRSVNK